MPAPDTIQIFVPLKVRKKNGRPKILPPADYLPSEDQTQDPHILRAIGRAWSWRRRMEAGEFTTIQELAEAVGLAERHVSRQLRLAYLAPEVLKRLTCGREASAVSLMICVFWRGRLGGSRWSRPLAKRRSGPQVGNAELCPHPAEIVIMHRIVRGKAGIVLFEAFQPVGDRLPSLGTPHGLSRCFVAQHGYPFAECLFDTGGQEPDVLPRACLPGSCHQGASWLRMLRHYPSRPSPVQA